MMKQLFIFALLLLLAIACNKEDCVTCENGQIIGETDAYIAWLEANGYEYN